MQGNKLSYMQTPHGRARVLSPERDYPYIGFDCPSQVETLTMTPSFATCLVGFA